MFKLADELLLFTLFVTRPLFKLTWRLIVWIKNQIVAVIDKDTNPDY